MILVRVAVVFFCVISCAFAAGVARHVLMNVSDVPGGTLLKGELAYDPKGAGVKVLLGDSDPVAYSTKPQDSLLGQTSFETNFTTFYPVARSRVRMSDGSIESMASTTYTLSAIHSATPFAVASGGFPPVGGWNYLWLAKSGSTYSVYASSASVAPVAPTSGVTYDKIGLIGTVQVLEYPFAVSNGKRVEGAGLVTRIFRPLRKQGLHYLMLGTDTWTQFMLTPSTLSATLDLDLPYSFQKANFAIVGYGLSPAPNGPKGCFNLNSEQQCTFGQGETSDRSIDLSHTASVYETPQLLVQSFDESADLYR